MLPLTPCWRRPVRTSSKQTGIPTPSSTTSELCSSSSDDDNAKPNHVVSVQSTVVRGDGAGHGSDDEETVEELENQKIGADVLQTGEALNTTADGLDLADLGAVLQSRRSR